MCGGIRQLREQGLRRPLSSVVLRRDQNRDGPPPIPYVGGILLAPNKSRTLKRKPLVEAILEVRWTLQGEAALGMGVDPNYRILLGRFSDRVRETYPAHEPLPAASMPDEMAAYVVQHRFRARTDGWPVVQLGPGVLTVNETEAYEWPDFQRRCEAAVKDLVDSYPSRSDLHVDMLTLRYIDARAFDYERDNILGFLDSMMKTTVRLPVDAAFFDDDAPIPKPSSVNLQLSFPHSKPDGTATIRLATGNKKAEKALIWETVVSSAGPEVPGMPEGFPNWLVGAHGTTHDWFFKLIEGELEKEFSSD